LGRKKRKKPSVQGGQKEKRYSRELKEKSDCAGYPIIRKPQIWEKYGKEGGCLEKSKSPRNCRH